MNSNNLLFIIILFLSMIGCNKEPKDTLAGGTGRGLKNGADWESKLYIKKGKGEPHSCEGCITIFLQTFSSEGYLRDDLGFGNIPLLKQRFLFSPPNPTSPKEAIAVSSYSDTVGHGDQFSSYYRAITNDPLSFIEITEIDGDKIKGIFEVTLVLDSLISLTDPSLPDTIRFEKGSFESN